MAPNRPSPSVTSSNFLGSFVGRGGPPPMLTRAKSVARRPREVSAGIGFPFGLEIPIVEPERAARLTSLHGTPSTGML